MRDCARKRGIASATNKRENQTSSQGLIRDWRKKSSSMAASNTGAVNYSLTRTHNSTLTGKKRSSFRNYEGRPSAQGRAFNLRVSTPRIIKRASDGYARCCVQELLRRRSQLKLCHHCRNFLSSEGHSPFLSFSYLGVPGSTGMNYDTTVQLRSTASKGDTRSLLPLKFYSTV